ncbi:MAG: hypothetical protein ACXVH7_14215, partial [Thermoanaerobaculia bacterium]
MGDLFGLWLLRVLLRGSSRSGPFALSLWHRDAEGRSGVVFLDFALRRVKDTGRPLPLFPPRPRC